MAEHLNPHQIDLTPPVVTEAGELDDAHRILMERFKMNDQQLNTLSDRTVPADGVEFKLIEHPQTEQDREDNQEIAKRLKAGIYKPDVQHLPPIDDIDLIVLQGRRRYAALKLGKPVAVVLFRKPNAEGTPELFAARGYQVLPQDIRDRLFYDPNLE